MALQFLEQYNNDSNEMLDHTLGGVKHGFHNLLQKVNVTLLVAPILGHQTSPKENLSKRFSTHKVMATIFWISWSSHVRVHVETINAEIYY